MDTNVISNDCLSFDDSSGRSDFASAGFGSFGGGTPVPEPATLALLAIGLAGLGLGLGRRRHGPK